MGQRTHPERAQTDLTRRFAEAVLEAEAEHETDAVEYLSTHPDWRARMAVLQRREILRVSGRAANPIQPACLHDQHPGVAGVRRQPDDAIPWPTGAKYYVP
jgi:hypothetical protein